MKRMAAALVAAACLFSCATAEGAGLSVQLELTKDVKPASSYTAEINSAVYSVLDFSDTQEAEFATCSLIDAPEVLELKDASGKAAWSQAAMQLIEKNLGSYPIKAVVISHSHADHFGAASAA